MVYHARIEFAKTRLLLKSSREIALYFAQFLPSLGFDEKYNTESIYLSL